MKRKLVSVLAIVMLLCMALPQTALAATTYYINVRISGPDANGVTQTVSASSSRYGTLKDPLAATVVQLINDKKDEIETKYTGTGLSEIFYEGLNAFEAGGRTWNNYVDKYVGDVSGNSSFKNIIKDKNSTFGDLTVDRDNQVSYTAESGKTYVVTVTLKTYGSGTTETITNPDGSTTTITTDPVTGTVTETTTMPNGVVGTTVTDKNGNITDISVSIPNQAVEEAEKTGEPIVLPVKVPNVTDSKDAPIVKVTLPDGVDSVKVEIPVQEVSSGLVAVIVDENGEETIVPKSIVSENGVILGLDESANVKIIDNSKSFDDVPADSWAADAVAFVSSRELFLGVSETLFAPNDPMTRGMLATVLYRLESEPDSDVQNVFDDVQADKYYTDGVYWAAENGVVTGYGDGTYRPDKNISRQELVAMLYRYSGEPAVADNTLDYPDAQAVHDYAKNAMRWAVDNGIIKGMPEGTLNPLGMATRAQVATMLMRYCNYVL